PLALGALAASTGRLSARLDPLWQALGLAPAVILALVFAALVEINFGAGSRESWGGMLRLALGGLVLGVADGALAGAILGTRGTLEEEFKQRYVGVALLRGEGALSNALPNV